MMYQNKAVLAIKANGKVLREFGEQVYVPYNTEYSILIKNLNTVRMVANITIDGQDVVPGGLVVSPKQEVDLERFVHSMDRGNKFKFIERTGNIEQHRGVKLEDGIVRVEFQFEKMYVQPTYNPSWTNTGYNPDSWKYNPMRSVGTGDAPDWAVGQVISSATYSSSNAISSQSMNISATATKGFATPANENGITVAGSESTQKFHAASWFMTETEKHCIVLKLLGQTPDNEYIRKPVTVKHQAKCDTCGRRNKITARFCSECGTALEVFGDNTSRPILQVK